MSLSTPISTNHGEAVLVEYNPDGKTSRVITQECTDGVKCFKEWWFTHSSRDEQTYIDSSDYLQEPASIELHGPCFIGGEPIVMRVWHIDGLPLHRFSHHCIPDQNSPVYAPVASIEDYAALGMQRIAEPLGGDPFGDAEVVEEFTLQLCNICGFMRDTNFCGHLGWTEDGLCGPGADFTELPESFKRVVRFVGCARSLRRQLRALGRAKRFILSPCIGRSSISLTVAGVGFSARANELYDLNDDENLREGTLWLLGLDATTTAANATALAWLDEEVAAQDARRASGERCYSVKGHAWRGKRWVVRGVSWADAIAALRALPAKDRHRSDGNRARISRSKHPCPAPLACPECGGRTAVAATDGVTPMCVTCRGDGDGVEMAPDRG